MAEATNAVILGLVACGAVIALWAYAVTGWPCPGLVAK